MMHKAAIDDNNYLITFLRDKYNLPIDEKDHYGNTPLHLACQENTKFASYWLIGFGHDVNVQNNNGDTPLHLILKSRKQLKNTKVVRDLVFRGIDKDIINKQRLKAVDLSQNVQESQIKKELMQIL